MIVGLITLTVGAGLPVGTAQAAKAKPRELTAIPSAIRGTWKSVNHPKTSRVHITGIDYTMEKNHIFESALGHANGYKVSKNTYRIAGSRYTNHFGPEATITVQKKGHRIGIKGSLRGLSTNHFTWFYK